jgi:hypothetical protein
MKLSILLFTLIFFMISCSGSASPGIQESNVGIAVWGLPACEGNDSAKWHNCTSQHMFWSKDGMKMYVSYRYQWRNGRQEGKYSEFYPDKFECEGFLKNFNGISKKDGKFSCRKDDGKTYHEFYVDGQLSKDKAFELSLDGYQKKCEVLGFTRGTDAFAECSLRLMELEERNAGSPLAGQQQDTRIQQQNTDAQRLEGLKEMLEGVQQGIDATKPPQAQRTDAACVQKCLSDGSMMSYCKSFCSY